MSLEIKSVLKNKVSAVIFFHFISIEHGASTKLYGT